MWRHIAGLNPDEAHPGWQNFTVAPRPGGGVTWAKAEYQSIRGRIATDWKVEGTKFTLQVVVPPNTIRVPTAQANTVRESGAPAGKARGVKFLRAEKDAAVFEVGSGSYSFEAR